MTKKMIKFEDAKLIFHNNGYNTNKDVVLVSDDNDNPGDDDDTDVL